MRNAKQALVLVSAVFVLGAAETPVKMDQLPAAVRQTVLEQTKGAQIRGFSKEVEHGKTYYEAETMRDGKSRDILMDSSGAVIEVEEQVTLDTIPEAARRAIEARQGAGKVIKVESVTRGSKVSYEALISKGGKKFEVAVGADGTIQK